jgi:hypothetical protein
MGIGSENNDDSTQHRDTTNEPHLPVPVEPDQSTHREQDPIEPRPYIEIRPSETRVDPGTVVQAMDLLASLLHELTNTGLLTSLRGNKENPLVEWLLVSDGREDPQLRYLVGTTHSDMTEDLLGILRTCFPNTKIISNVFTDDHLADALFHEDLDGEEIKDRVAGLRLGEWIVQLPSTGFKEQKSEILTLKPLQSRLDIVKDWSVSLPARKK